MTRIFTARFFRLSEIDQAAIVDAHVRELESLIGRLVDPEGERRVKRQLRDLRKRAAEHGFRTEEAK
jgi:hypothetical protein